MTTPACKLPFRSRIRRPGAAVRIALPLLLLGLAAQALAAGPAATRDSGDADLSEAAGWLRHYLTLDTTNPPGDERRAALWLAGLLRAEGLEPRLYTSPAGRTSLVARIRADATRPRPALMLMHHIDVVAPGEGWTVQPFAGLLKDDRLWGRGAIDAKSLGIAQLAAVIELQRARRRGLKLDRDVVYAAVADEENGGVEGVGWLLEAHPEVFRDLAGVLNEGGVTRLRQGEVRWWGLEISQKRPLWLEVTATGRGSHGSSWNPGNANHALVQALARLVDRPLRWRVDEPVRLYLEAVAPFMGNQGPVLADIEKHIRPDGPTVGLMPGMANLFLDSVQVTLLEAGHRINVIPATARALLDIRLLPDTDHVAFLAQVEQLLGDYVSVEVVLDAPRAAPSPVTGPVWQTLERVLSAEAPVVPTMIHGFTDSRYFRERGIPAYGLAPFVIEGPDLMGIHAADERIPVAAFDDGVERVTRLVRAWAAPSEGP